MRKLAKYLPLEIFVSLISQMTKPHQNPWSSPPMCLVRGSLREAHSQHQAIEVIAYKGNEMKRKNHKIHDAPEVYVLTIDILTIPFLMRRTK